MKFTYLKLTLLMATLMSASLSVQAQDATTQAEATTQADIEAAVLRALDLLNPKGTQKRTLDETLAEIDKAIEVLIGRNEYQALCKGLQGLKNTLVQFNVAQAQGLLNSVTGELEALRATLSPAVRAQVETRLEELKKLKLGETVGLLNRLGVTLPSWKTLFGKK